MEAVVTTRVCTMSKTYQLLKDRQRRERGTHHPNLALRVHRALSWLHRAEQSDDADGKFIFLWIAFNAAYSQEHGERERPPEQAAYQSFLAKLSDLDGTKSLYELVWTSFPSSIRILLKNQYVFQPFWDFQAGRIDKGEWVSAFSSANAAANRALANQDTVSVLSIVMSRLYTLRNQLMHGGATWDSKTNRAQMRDSVAFMERLVPIVIEIMLDHPKTLWGDASYPVLNV